VAYDRSSVTTAEGFIPSCEGQDQLLKGIIFVLGDANRGTENMKETRAAQSLLLSSYCYHARNRRHARGQMEFHNIVTGKLRRERIFSKVDIDRRVY
jgi:hypothetical protein